MGLTIRTPLLRVLVWLLVLAVPAQAIAAVTMAFCGPNHHTGGVATLGQQTAQAAQAHHGSVEVGLHAHPDSATGSDAQTSASAEATAPAQPSDASGQKCSACASCCFAGAIFNTLLAVPAPVAAPTVFDAVVPSVEFVAADGPDRPPRIVLA